MLVSPVHPSKAQIVVTLSGIVMLVSLLQPENPPQMRFTPLGIVYLVKKAGAKATRLPSSLIRHLPSFEANLPLNEVRLLHPSKALLSTSVTLSGIVMLVRLLQPANAPP
jgi:hypothetical protein